MNRPIAGIVGGLLIILAERAAAQETAPEPEAPARRTLLVEGAAGMGTPVGWLGASLVVAPIDGLAIHGGAGIGSQSPQIAVGARGRLRTGPRSKLGLGLSWSTGEHAGVESGLIIIPPMFDGRAPIYFWRRAHFVNLEGGLEYDMKSVVLRPHFGFGYVVNDGYSSRTTEPSTYTGVEPRVADTSPFLARMVPYFGFAIAFGVL